MSVKIKMLIVLLIILSSFFFIPQVSADETEPTLVSVDPEPLSTVRNSTPKIRIEYYDTDGIDEDGVVFRLDNRDLTFLEETKVTQTYAEHPVPQLLKLRDGNHTVYIEIPDEDGNVLTYEYNFTVDTTPLPDNSAQERFIMIIQAILFFIVVGLVLGAIYLVYLAKIRGFSFKKFFIRHPNFKDNLFFITPIVASATFVLLGFTWVGFQNDPYPFAYEYILVVGFYLGIGYFAIESQRRLRKIENYEHAFAQLLFELADAIRGGIDPAKAIVELAQNDTGAFRKHLNIASKNIRIGRSFEEVLQTLVTPTKSELCRRYASLIGESHKVGGDISTVIHRAAKDMDDLIKVNDERKRKIMMQMVTVYIAFSVLLVIIFILINVYPYFSNIDLSVITDFNLEGAAEDTIDEVASGLTYVTLKRRFFHLSLINSIGTGFVLGKISHGKVKYGLVHSMIMVGVTTAVFAIGIF